MARNTKGYRRGTRYLFARRFRHRGPEHLSTYLQVFKRGEFVDIKGNGAIQKGMPHKCYHGRTGRVYNVTRRGLGVCVNKRVRGRIMPKKICVRIEHVKKSRCNEEFEKRKEQNKELKQKAKEAGVRVTLKRQPQGPREGHFIKLKNKRKMIRDLAPVAYQHIM
jgi:large subunit ribosomal protein L21e